MEIVNNIIGFFDTLIATTAQAFFESLATGIGPLVTICLTLVVVLVGLNMALNVYQISSRESVQIIVRIVILLMFGLSWSNFGVIYDALTNGSASIATSFFATAADSALGDSPAKAMDGFAGRMADVSDVVLKAVGSIPRGLLGALLYIALAVLMGAYILIVVFAKMMLAFLIGVAPLAILFTVFEKTRPLFEAWMTALIGYLMYPIAAAVVVSLVVSLSADSFSDLGEGNTLGSILSFLVVVVCGIGTLMSIPTAVSNLSGQFNLAGIAPQALKVGGAPVGAAASLGLAKGRNTLRDLTSGLLNKGAMPNEAAYNRSKMLAERGFELRQKLTDINKLKPSNLLKKKG